LLIYRPVNESGRINPAFPSLFIAPFSRSGFLFLFRPRVATPSYTRYDIVRAQFDI
jgi:hypothetical protein